MGLCQPLGNMFLFNISKFQRISFSICENVTLCRQLSVTFGLIFLDEILLTFQNRKASTNRRFTLNEADIDGQLAKWWQKIINVKHHKTFRMIQTRYAECSALGFNNIAVTTCQLVATNTTANFTGFMGTKKQIDFISKKDNFNYVVTIESNTFLPGIAGLTKMIDIALGRSSSIPFTVKHRKKYYRIRISAMCVIPFFVPRYLAENSITTKFQEIRDNSNDNPSPLF